MKAGVAVPAGHASMSVAAGMNLPDAFLSNISSKSMATYANAAGVSG